VSSTFSAAELEEIRRADLEIEKDFVLTAEETKAARRRDTYAKDGLADDKSLAASASRRYKAQNRERLAEYSRQYYEANKDHIAENHRRYVEANKGQIAEYKRRYTAANRERIAAYKREYRRRRKSAEAQA